MRLGLQFDLSPSYRKIDRPRLNIAGRGTMIGLVNIDPPPLWEHLLLEQPWLPAIALVVVALLLRYTARQRKQPRLGYAALGLAMIAGGLIASGILITTDRQRLVEQTHELLEATQHPGDFATVERLLAENVVLTGPGGQVWLRDQAIRDRLADVIDRFRIESQTVRDIAAETIDARHGRSGFDLRTYTGAGLGLPVHSVWTLHWQRDDEDAPWRIARVQWDELNGQPPGHGDWRR